MKRNLESHHSHRPRRKGWLAGYILALALSPVHARASIFKGEALDKLADILTWVVLVVAPIVAIAVFLLIHILPEKIAERKGHPQTKAIQCLCLLSLVFGGILWPLAWLWAYTKPVIYKLAYGTDKLAHGHENGTSPEEEEELQHLRQRIHEIEMKHNGNSIEHKKG